MKNQVFIDINNNSRESNGLQNQNEENGIFKDKKLLTFRKSKAKFITKKDYKKKYSNNFISNEGRWSEEEHEKFLEGIVKYGKNWKKVKTLIGTRTITQVISHAQKFFSKMKVCKDEILGIDFTSNTVGNIRDMINQIKNNNFNFNIINVFKYLTYKYDNIEKSKKKIVERRNKNTAFKINELNNQSNIINLKEDNSNIDANNFFINQINNINKIKRMKEKQSINDNGQNDITKMINQNNIFNILHNLLEINYKSNVFNSLLTNNLYSSIYDIANNINKLLINYLISNNALNAPNIINENVLLSFVLQNNLLNYIISINYINNIRYINNGNNIDKVKDNDENSLFNNIGKKDNINSGNNNDYKYNFGNKDNNNYNITINKNDFIFCSDKQLNKICDKKKNNNNEN